MLHQWSQQNMMIKNPARFRTLLSRGIRHPYEHVVLFQGRTTGPHQTLDGQLGIIASRKVRPTPLRNRWKRCIKAYWRTHNLHRQFKNDLVVLIKTSAPQLGETAVTPYIQKVLQAEATRCEQKL